ncbi:MAG: NADH-quinone oxidoreductase subunit I [Verrucomicrobiota bacterium]
MEHPATTSRPSGPPPTAAWTLPGIGLLKGLAVTATNMIQSYYRKDRMTTVQYPEERATISPNFRNFPFLVYDGSDAMAGLRCTACSICENECPPQCIYIVLDRDENGKSLKRPKVFDIDVSVCMNCGICAEVCPFDSIYMDGEYELSTSDRFGDLLFNKQRLARSTDYHAQLRPLEAAEVAARRKADEEKKLAAQAAKEAKAKADKEAKEKAAKEQAAPE